MITLESFTHLNSSATWGELPVLTKHYSSQVATSSVIRFIQINSLRTYFHCNNLLMSTSCNQKQSLFWITWARIFRPHCFFILWQWFTRRKKITAFEALGFLCFDLPTENTKPPCSIHFSPLGLIWSYGISSSLITHHFYQSGHVQTSIFFWYVQSWKSCRAIGKHNTKPLELA